MKKGDLVKPTGPNSWMLDGYGIGIVLSVNSVHSVKVYWPSNKFWCVTLKKNLEKV